MRASVLGAVLLLASVSPSRARIGDTPEKCQKRYGKHLTHAKHDKVICRDYTNGGYSIKIVFARKKGKRAYRAHCIEYSKNGLPFSQAEVTTLLKKNSETEWKRQEANGMEFWVTPDGLTGDYDSKTHVVDVSTASFKDYVVKKLFRDFDNRVVKPKQ